MKRIELQPLERARIVARLLLVELLDESISAGELCRIARSVQRSVREYELGVEGLDEEIDPQRSPQRELSSFAEQLVEILLATGDLDDGGNW